MKTLALWGAGLVVMMAAVNARSAEPQEPDIRLTNALNWEEASSPRLANTSSDLESTSCDGCRPIVSCCEPLWNIYVGALILDRGSGSIAEEGVQSPDLGWRGGIDVDLRRRLGSQTQLQVRYFGIDAWEEGTPFSTIVPQFGYTSNLHSTEVNLRRRWTDCLTILGGFRWVELGEELFEFPDKGNPINTNNHLYGGQIGAELLLWGCCDVPLQVTTGAKAGIFYNRAGYRAPELDLADQTGHTAFLGEFDVTARYRLTNHWALRTGYQLLWIEGVALAGSQRDNPAPDFSVDTSGSPFYHGVTVGAELTF